MMTLTRTDGTEAEYNGERTVEGISKCKSNIADVPISITHHYSRSINASVFFSVLTTDGVYGLAAPDSEPTPVKDEL